jgi:predicted nucleic acid-binding protein
LERCQAFLAEGSPASGRREVGGRLCEGGAPLILFLDTSALIKLFIEETGTADVQHALQAAAAVAVAEITYVEAHSALARMRAGERLSGPGYRAKRSELDEFWSGVVIADISTQVIRRAADLAARHVLRAYDAVQLAAALVVLEADETAFGCWDGELRRAARAERLTLVPS